jgi:hypothetical protein
MMDAADPASLRAEHDLLMARLSARRSTEHFAHTAVSTFFALIFAGGAGKLYWDDGGVYLELVLVGSAIAAGLLLHAVVRYVRGHRALAYERTEFERLGALRRSLGIDDPAAMLPR